MGIFLTMKLWLDMTKTWNRTINRMMHGMGNFHGKAILLIHVTFLYQFKHWYATKNDLIIYLKRSCSGLLKQYQYYTMCLKSACFVYQSLHVLVGQNQANDASIRYLFQWLNHTREEWVLIGQTSLLHMHIYTQNVAAIRNLR